MKRHKTIDSQCEGENSNDQEREQPSGSTSCDNPSESVLVNETEDTSKPSKVKRKSKHLPSNSNKTQSETMTTMSSLKGMFGKKPHDAKEAMAFRKQMEEESDFDLLPFQNKEELVGATEGVSAQPFYLLVNELDIMCAYNKDLYWSYFLLIYTMWHGGVLDWEGISDFDQDAKKYKNMELLANDCGIPSTELSFRRVETYAEKLKGEYLEYKQHPNSYKGYYVFLNTKVAEAVTYSFTKRNERESIKRLPLQFFYDYIRTVETPRDPLDRKEEETKMFFYPYRFKDLFERFVPELENGNVREVITQPVFFDANFVYDLINYLRHKNKMKEFFTAVDKKTKSGSPDSVLYCAVAQHKPCIALVRAMVEKEDYEKLAGDKKWAAEQKTKTLELACKLGIFPVYKTLVEVAPPLTERCLYRTACGGSVDIMMDLLLRQEWTEDQKMFALRLACLYGYHDVYSTIKNTITSPSEDSLYEATAGGNLDIVVDMLVMGFNLNIVCAEGRTPLHIASELGHNHIAEYIVRREADVNVRDDQERTPLHLGSGTGQTDVAEMLIIHGADVNAKDRTGLTPLHVACENGHVETVKTLVEMGAETGSTDVNGHTPLHQSALNGHLEVAQFLITQGSDVTVRDSNGNTLFQMACLNGNCDILWYMKGQNPDVLYEESDEGWLPVHFAFYAGHSAAVKLLARWSDVMVMTRDQLQPLQLVKKGKKAKGKKQNDLFGCVVKFGDEEEFGETLRFLGL